MCVKSCRISPADERVKPPLPDFEHISSRGPVCLAALVIEAARLGGNAAICGEWGNFLLQPQKRAAKVRP